MSASALMPANTTGGHMKTCSKCGEVKPLTEYYRDARSKGGLRSCCKPCHIEAVKTWIVANPEKHATYRDRWKRENPEKTADRISRWQQANPEKHRAHVAVMNAIRHGKIVSQPCVVCGDKKSEGHHPDYSKPLEVVWLCRKHHMMLHRGMDLAKRAGTIA